jgi:hypothetical protein
VRVVVKVRLPGVGRDTGMLAVITVVPTARARAEPLLPGALLMVATELLDEVQVVAEVTSWVVPSERVPVALNAMLAPTVAD